MTTPKARFAVRVAVVKEMKSGKFSASEVAADYGVTTASVKKWVAIVETQGTDGLHEQKRGRKNKVEEAPAPKRSRKKVAEATAK